jgi:hypothetical protein
MLGVIRLSTARTIRNQKKPACSGNYKTIILIQFGVIGIRGNVRGYGLGLAIDILSNTQDIAQFVKGNKRRIGEFFTWICNAYSFHGFILSQ